jgi:hypothetical protein
LPEQGGPQKTIIFGVSFAVDSSIFAVYGLPVLEGGPGMPPIEGAELRPQGENLQV